MAYVEKCDMVWGANGSAVLLSGDFDRRLEEHGRTSKRASNITAPSTRTSSLQSRRNSTRGSPAQSFDSISESSVISETSEGGEMGDVDERRKLVNRASARVRRMARNTGEIGLKIVALPTFVLLDMVS